MLKRLLTIITNVRLWTKKTYNSWKRDIKKRPLTNFYLALGAFLLLIILSSVLRPAIKPEATQKAQTQEVTVYSIGSVPKMATQAQIEKTGVVKIVALTNGVVQKIYAKEGDTVGQGATIISLSSNYQGGNAASVQRQLAQNQYNASLDTFGLQKDLIGQQRTIATTSAENADRLREISGQSRDATRTLVDLNKTMLDSVSTNLTTLQNDPQADPTMIASLQAQKAQLLSGLIQAQSALSNADYQSAGDKPPADLTDLQKNLTLKQLDLQEKMLDINKESAHLQLQLAQISEALMYPVSPVKGTIQRIFVKEGDVVAPGVQLAVISQAGTNGTITAIAYVPGDSAARVSRIEPSIVHIGNATDSIYPYYISTEAVQGNLYAVYFAIPQQYTSDLTEKDYITIDIPIGYANTTAAISYVPLDAIYQTTDMAYLFVAQQGKAKSKTVKLGNVYGEVVEVYGLQDGDQVIITRNVVNGDPVVITK